MKPKLLTYTAAFITLAGGFALTSCAGAQGARGQATPIPTQRPGHLQPSPSERYYDPQTEDWKFERN